MSSLLGVGTIRKGRALSGTRALAFFLVPTTRRNSTGEYGGFVVTDSVLGAVDAALVHDVAGRVTLVVRVSASTSGGGVGTLGGLEAGVFVVDPNRVGVTPAGSWHVVPLLHTGRKVLAKWVDFGGGAKRGAARLRELARLDAVRARKLCGGIGRAHV